MTITKSQQEPRVCLNCDAEYSPIKPWQKTCSYVCGYTLQNAKKKRGITNKGLCARCGTGLENKKAHAIYCSKTCKSMDHNFKHRAKTRVQGVARRKEIYDRDGGLCYLCKELVPFDRFELDHLVPHSRAGDSSPTNLAVTCISCNRRRGTKLGIEQLLKLSELRTPI